MSRTKKLKGLLAQARAEGDPHIYLDYIWNESSERRRLRKQARASRKTNRQAAKRKKLARRKR